ncbi:hypothetical protein IJ579_07495 [bacterium]|nr:hypothetical protein [bacterium]
MKNRCTVLLRQGNEIIGTFRPTQKLFNSLLKELEPKRVLYDKKCFITLKQENVLMGNYKVEEKQFNRIKDRVEKYRSIGHICKNVRCVETGQIFENAKQASRWVSEIRENFYNCCDPDLIKQCCRGKQKTSYGYHWEFVK